MHPENQETPSPAKKRVRKASGSKPKARKAAGKSNAGRKSKLAGKRIIKLVKENPRRKGTHGHKTFSLYTSGAKVEQVLAKGGRPQDVAWDLAHKYIRLAS